jgi:TetR/AcrR family transcriptional regulator
VRKPKRETPRAKISRNPEQTRRRIVDAALKEFARHGFAGARVDAIARAARINKRMLYHYFEDKQGLFREVLRHKILERKAFMAQAPENIWEALPSLAELMATDIDWIRLLEYEALQWGEGKQLIDEPRRKETFRQAVESVRAQQSAGKVAAEFDPAQLILSVLALTAYPFAFPQVTRLLTGMRVSSAEFQKKRAEFLRAFAARLQGKR